MGGRRVVKNHEILGDVIYDDPLSQTITSEPPEQENKNHLNVRTQEAVINFHALIKVDCKWQIKRCLRIKTFTNSETF